VLVTPELIFGQRTPDWKKLEELYAPTPKHEWDKLKRKQQLSVVTDDFHEYAPRNLKIESKGLEVSHGIPDGTLIPFRMNRSQLWFHHCLQLQRAKTGRTRCKLLKGRQWGGSTYIEAFLYWDTTRRRGCNTVIFSHEDKSTAELFDMVKTFHECSHPSTKPIVGQTNAQALIFSRLNSKYELATAGKKDVMRSKRVTHLHWSETASSPHAEDHKKGIWQTVPESNDTTKIMETTAKGKGGVFYVDWIDAVESEGWDDISVFVPWYWHEEYRRPLPDNWERTPEEDLLAKQFELDDEQLCWRRWKIKDMKGVHGNREDAFKQEYPMTWQEAFQASGSLVFSLSALTEIERHLRAPSFVGRVDLSGDRPKIVPDVDGELRIYQAPDMNARYVVGADVAKGLEHGDDSVACIVNAETGEDAAVWSGHVNSTLFADILEFLGKHYSMIQPNGRRVSALLIPEITGGYGDATVNRLRNELKYPHVYQAIQRTTEHQKKQWGFDTTKNSKPLLIEALVDLTENEPHLMRDRETWRQMGVFVRKFSDNNPHSPPKMEAIDGEKDDHVIARALAAIGVISLRGPRAVTEKERELKARRDAALSEQRKGKKAAKRFFGSKSSTPGWKPIKKAASVDEIKSMIKSLEDSKALEKGTPNPEPALRIGPVERRGLSPRKKRWLG
jgi:hypothetical protein